jgi:hypothetical protein
MKRILWFGTVVCTALLGLEVAGFPWQAGQPLVDAAAGAVDVARIGAAAAQAPSVPAPVDQWVAAILARPLFAPTRQETRQASQHEGPPRLSGIVSWRGGNDAIFRLATTPSSVVVGPGAVLNEWTVQIITADSVTLQRGDELLVLRPSFTDAGPIPAPSRIASRTRDRWGRHFQPPSYLDRRG